MERKNQEDDISSNKPLERLEFLIRYFIYFLQYIISCALIKLNLQTFCYPLSNLHEEKKEEVG